MAARVLAVLPLAIQLLACGAPPARTLAPPRSTPPSPRDVVAALVAHGDLRPTDASCESITGDPADDTLAPTTSHLLGVLAEAQRDGDQATFTASCVEGAAPWHCTFEVSVVAEDPWRYAITFDLGEDGAIDPSTVRCPGVG